MSDIAVLEKPMGEKPTGERPMRPCPNCGAESPGQFCPECGEEIEPRLSHIGHYISDVIREFVALDTKLMHTLPALLFRPGLLAQEFVAGRRRRYLSPLRLHIIIGIGLFISLGYYTRTRLEGQITSVKDRQQLDSALHQANQAEAAHGGEAVLPESVKEFKTMGETVNRIAAEVGPYVLLLTSTPLFASVLWVLYRKRKSLFVEHLIFSLYFFSFAYLLLIPPLLLHSKPLFLVCATLFTVHLYFGLRRYYADRSYGLIFRTLSCVFACAFITGFAFILSLFAAWAFGGMMGELPSGFHGRLRFHD